MDCKNRTNLGVLNESDQGFFSGNSDCSFSDTEGCFFRDSSPLSSSGMPQRMIVLSQLPDAGADVRSGG